jgi:hypothetical protein
MKIALLSESPADEAAIRALVEGLLEKAVEVVAYPRLPAGGWQVAMARIRPVMVHLHYRTDAVGLVVVIDSDDAPVHRPEHDQPGGAREGCRLCQLRAAVAEVQSGLRPRQGRGPVKTALGLAVPAIEAWYLAGLDRHVTEAAWIAGQESRCPPYTRLALKTMAYGTDRPPLDIERESAIRHVQRITREAKLSLLEDHFPHGFGALARDVRSWRSPGD